MRNFLIGLAVALVMVGVWSSSVFEGKMYEEDVLVINDPGTSVGKDCVYVTYRKDGYEYTVRADTGNNHISQFQKVNIYGYWWKPAYCVYPTTPSQRKVKNEK